MLKKIIKAMIPPILLRLKHIGAPFYGIKGEFSSWKDAEEALQRKGLQDYAADNILQTVWKAIQTVREGEAEFERDGVLFYKKEAPRCLIWVGERNKCSLCSYSLLPMDKLWDLDVEIQLAAS